MKQTHPLGLRFAMQWALESASDPATAAADWLARDICPNAVSAVDMITSPNVTLDQLRQAKDVYKTMRMLGETKADRRMGGRLYLAAIAAALVVHGQKISRQSDYTVSRALADMAGDHRVSLSLRKLADQARPLLQGQEADAEASTSPKGAGQSNGFYDPADDEDSLPMEIERAYLLDRLPMLPDDTDAVRIEQGYLSDEAELEGRLRREVRSDGSVILTHTIKKGSGLVRSEIERPITPEEFERHWPATQNHRLTKTRYLARSDEFAWEIDVFDKLDLVLAEVELPTATTIATPPPWLAKHIVREVTHEKEFRNHQLALRLAKLAL